MNVIQAMKKTGVLLALGVLLLGSCGGAKAQGMRTNRAGTSPVRLSETPTPAPAALPVPAAPLVQVTPTRSPPQNAAGARGGTGEVFEIREKLFIAQINDVYQNPEDYLGRTIKLEGLFKREQFFGGAGAYCFVLRYGPGCCGSDGDAGFEVAWDRNGESYPGVDDWVEAVGTLSTYEEEGYPYLYLSLSSLRVLDQRGAEFVSQ